MTTLTLVPSKPPLLLPGPVGATVPEHPGPKSLGGNAEGTGEEVPASGKCYVVQFCTGAEAGRGRAYKSWSGKREEEGKKCVQAGWICMRQGYVLIVLCPLAYYLLKRCFIYNFICSHAACDLYLHLLCVTFMNKLETIKHSHLDYFP